MVFGLFGVLIFYLSAQVAHPSIWAFYTMLKFDWNIQQVGISLSVYGCMTLLVQGFAIGYIVRRIGEEKATYIGLFIASICFIGYASATHGWMIYAWIIPGGFAFGDRYYENATGEYTCDPGQMCVEAPVTKLIMNIYERKELLTK